MEDYERDDSKRDCGEREPGRFGGIVEHGGKDVQNRVARCHNRG